MTGQPIKQIGDNGRLLTRGRYSILLAQSKGVVEHNAQDNVGNFQILARKGK